MSRKRIVVCDQVCIGCHLCEVHCLTAHSRSKDVYKAHRRETPRALARVHVEEAGPISLAVRCMHCDDAPCVAACLTGAMQKDPLTGLVSADATRCMGGWTCVMVCPYGAPVRDLTRHVILKCDLCPDLAIPACVANCPNGALKVEEMTA